MINNKGRWCPYKPIICAEGFCSECAILQDYENKTGGACMSGGMEASAKWEEKRKAEADRKYHASNQVSDARKAREMEFDADNKVIISTLNKEQAQAFILFLESECLRHLRDVAEARVLIDIVKATRL